jgi:uncharacterized membrane protein
VLTVAYVVGFSGLAVIIVVFIANRSNLRDATKHRRAENSQHHWMRALPVVPVKPEPTRRRDGRKSVWRRS